VKQTGTDQAVIIADPALRQAIWNLLDNAAQVSPNHVTLYAERTANELVLSVRDRGSGFAPAIMANFGKPCQSSKGPGHGVGLFLVANVMRRLDGRVEVSNLPEGGAQVRLFLPLATV
jgi:two-component system sensor histidine kinase RegB